MAEILGIFALTALAGYLNSKITESSSDEKFVPLPLPTTLLPDNIPLRKELPQELLPNSNNRVEEVKESMQKMADNLVEESKTPQFTGILPPLFNTYGTRGQKIQMEERANAQKMAEIANFNKLANVMTPTGKEKVVLEQISKMSSGVLNLNEEPFKDYSLLTGKPFEKSHNNMTPFFGGSVKQRIEEFANVPLIERFTGTEPKIERSFNPRFQLQKENIYGSPAFTTQVDMSRFIASPFRENELPFEQTRVKAPISWGPEDNIKPQFKTIDELVVNAKESYAGRLIESGKLSGGRGDQRGITADVKKNRPETSFEWDSSRLFKTTGAHLEAKMKSDFDAVLRDQKTISTSYFGNSFAGSDKSKTTTRIVRNDDNGTLVTKPSSIKRRFLENNADDFVRNYGTSSKINENLKNTYFANDTQRANKNTQILAANRGDSGHQQYSTDLPKLTTKETTLFDNSSNNVSKTGSFVKQSELFDKNPLKTTNKQMNLNSYKGQAQRGSGLGYIDAISNSLAKTTNKETVMFEQRGMPAKLISSEMSRDQYKEATLATQLENDGRISGPQKFQISGSKDLINISVKDREIKNKRSSNVDFINKELPSQELIGSIITPKNLDNTAPRTFEVSPEIFNQLKNNEFSLVN